MVTKDVYKPPFGITPQILNCSSKISQLIGRYEGLMSPRPQPQLRRQNKIRTIRGSLSIEGNSLSEKQITAILDGRRVIGPKREIVEVQNAIEVYDRAANLNPTKEKDLLAAHKVMMKGLAEDAGRYRIMGVGVVHGREIAHMAPPHARVPLLMAQLFSFLKAKSEVGDLIKSAVFHYEMEFIHPFSDGNGRMGRLWQHVILRHFHPLFELLPIESVIKSHQEEYYRVLGVADKAGDSTVFIDFSLWTILESLEGFLSEIKPQPHTTESRLEFAREHFARREFSRKDYMDLFKTLSTATASRDLKGGVERKVLSRSGDKVKARYRYE